ncbi:hypothetical protein GCM10008986_15380 [Salinibacillus aidingensis]|uniref:Uncharacterized protein n=1 Tax=Salinibacillus aidingensis TaxID=237684 RepID=A0ABP3L3A9_9BACI
MFFYFYFYNIYLPLVLFALYNNGEFKKRGVRDGTNTIKQKEGYSYYLYCTRCSDWRYSGFCLQ